MGSTRHQGRAAMAVLLALLANATSAVSAELVFNADAEYETAVIWQYGGVQAPDFGSFAERYEGSGLVEALVVDLTNPDLIFPEQGPSTMMVWADDGGAPGEVLVIRTDIHIPALHGWPEFSRVVREFEEPVTVGNAWWIGLWPPWVDSWAEYWIGLDEDGAQVTAATKVAPSQQWPMGWQRLDVVWPEESTWHSARCSSWRRRPPELPRGEE
ncbi:MAG: hypothetical protein U0527_07745 [Candidatus Eisenbacteria bacterium]